MKIRGPKDGLTLEFTSGDSMKFGREPVDVPAEFVAETRIAALHVFGLEIVEDPEREKAIADEKAKAPRDERPTAPAAK